MSSCEFCEMPKNTFSYRTPLGDCFYYWLFWASPFQPTLFNATNSTSTRDITTNALAVQWYLRPWTTMPNFDRHGLSQSSVSGHDPQKGWFPLFWSNPLGIVHKFWFQYSADLTELINFYFTLKSSENRFLIMSGVFEFNWFT